MILRNRDWERALRLVLGAVGDVCNVSPENMPASLRMIDFETGLFSCKNLIATVPEMDLSE